MKRSKDDVNVNSPLKPVDHPDLEDDRGLMRDDKEQRRRNEEEKDQIAEDPAAEPLHDADENFGTSPVSPASEGLDFLHNIKENLCNPENFQDLLKYLHIYGRNIITREELQLLVGHLLGESVDLMKGFNDFLSLCENHQKWLEESCESHQIFVE